MSRRLSKPLKPFKPEVVEMRVAALADRIDRTSGKAGRFADQLAERDWGEHAEVIRSACDLMDDAASIVFDLIGQAHGEAE